MNDENYQALFSAQTPYVLYIVIHWHHGNETVKDENKDSDDASASTNDNDNDNDDGAAANDESDVVGMFSQEYYRNGNTTVSNWYDHLRKWIPLINLLLM